MAIAKNIQMFLNENNVPYNVIHHKRDYTAQEAAADTHTPGKKFVKTIILFVDNNFCMCVLPAPGQIDMEKIKKQLNARSVTLATEDEIATICPDCEVGAMPPFGLLYNLPVYVSADVEDEMITFNAGTHEDVIRMRFADFTKLVRPSVLDITE